MPRRRVARIMRDDRVVEDIVMDAPGNLCLQASAPGRAVTDHLARIDKPSTVLPDGIEEDTGLGLILQAEGDERCQDEDHHADHCRFTPIAFFDTVAIAASGSKREVAANRREPASRAYRIEIGAGNRPPAPFRMATVSAKIQA